MDFLGEGGTEFTNTIFVLISVLFYNNWQNITFHNGEYILPAKEKQNGCYVSWFGPVRYLPVCFIV